MPTPLTFYTLLKQDADSQQKMVEIQAAIPGMTTALSRSQIVHYARFVPVQNSGAEGSQAMMIITEFDDTMESYIEFFFNDPDINKAFTLIAQVSVRPPKLPLELNDFTNWVITNNLSQKQPPMFCAYPQTVKQILARFSSGV